jgi:Flp pilus assembly protein TadG
LEHIEVGNLRRIVGACSARKAANNKIVSSESFREESSVPCQIKMVWTAKSNMLVKKEKRIVFVSFEDTVGFCLNFATSFSMFSGNTRVASVGLFYSDRVRRQTKVYFTVYRIN